MNEIKNYGLKLSPLEDLSAYRLGAIELPKLVLRRDGQYDNYLPEDELQHTPSFDTYGCTIYGTENIQQTMERVHGLESKEYDERYNYNLAKIVPPGADPHVVSDIFRLNGVVSGVFPMVGTLAEYATPRPMPSKYISQGVAHPHELRHQWLWQKPISKEERTKLIKEYLQYSPLGVSVTAWKQSNGVYVDDGQPNTHWTMLYGYNDKGWKIYDSYFPHRKILSYDHNIQVCKRYILVPSSRLKQISILQQLINALKKLLGLKEKELSTPPVITPPEPELSETLAYKIHREAWKWLGKDASPTDKAPDELACAESVCNILQQVGVPIPLLVSTIELHSWLVRSPLFTPSLNFKAGSIIISPTGMGNGKIKNGHVGIIGEKKIMSNDSGVGMWLENYTLDEWVARYRTKGGYPIYFHEPVDKGF